MFSLLYYIFMVVLCTLLLVLSAVALVICAPFDPARRVVHELSRFVVKIFFAIPPFWRWRVVGMENIDPKRSYVIILNHNAMLDIPSLYALPLNFRWVSKRQVFATPFFGQLLVLHGDIAIERGNGAVAMAKVIEQGKMWISRGVSISMFPEGTRSKDGQIGRFKSGAFNLAKEAGVEILPVVLSGSRDMIKDNFLFSWRHEVILKVLPPISVERIEVTERKELINEVREQMLAAFETIRG
ncbi:MAG: lysophospholipid acyltransferase family protein [Rikenellaceae bacterium]